MATAQLGVLLSLQDNATPQLKSFTTTLSANKMAIRELAMGTAMLGASFMAMGVALKGSNSQLGQTVGQTLMMVGSIMTAIGSTVQFISAIAKTVDALKKLATMEAIVKAFQGPAGWAILLGSIAVAGGAVAGINAMSKAEKKTEVNVNVQGSVVTQKQLIDDVRRGIILGQQRNNTSGIK